MTEKIIERNEAAIPKRIFILLIRVSAQKQVLIATGVNHHH
jgi:hypothetical protein